MIGQTSIQLGDTTWVSAAGAREHLGPDVSDDVLRGWYRTGRVQRVAFGRRYWYPLPELQEAERATRTNPVGRPRQVQLDQAA